MVTEAKELSQFDEVKPGSLQINSRVADLFFEIAEDWESKERRVQRIHFIENGQRGEGVRIDKYDVFDHDFNTQGPSIEVMNYPGENKMTIEVTDGYKKHAEITLDDKTENISEELTDPARVEIIESVIRDLTGDSDEDGLTNHAIDILKEFYPGIALPNLPRGESEGVNLFALLHEIAVLQSLAR